MRRLKFKIPFLLLASISILRAQYPGVQGTVERQIQILEQKRAYAESNLNNGDKAMADKDYESAYSFYKSAVDTLPQGGAATASVRANALADFTQATLKLANQRISEGRYADAKLIVEVNLEDRYSPNDSQTLALRARLLDPQGFPDRGTLTPQHVQRIEEVKKLINEGQGFFETARYDLAFKRCEQALNIDKYNLAARKLMEKINSSRQKYAEKAYNESRSDMIAKVSKAWELPVRKFTDGPTSIIEQPQIAAKGTQVLSDKLDSIIIPKIDFNDSSIRDALEFIKRKAHLLDTSEPKGINIVLKIKPDSPEASSQITLGLSDVPLRAALDYVARAANLKIKVEPHAVVIVPQAESTDILITKEYKVPPSFIQSLPGKAAPVRSAGSGTQSVIAARSGALEYLEAQGVTFPEGASANYIPSTSRLIVKNTQDQLELIDTLVDNSLSTRPTQIEIEAKFLEVNQNNLNELGFEWLLGQFSMPGGTGVYGSGGTEGFGRSLNPAGYPALQPSGIPVGANSLTSGPITGGNRGGSTAISANAIDALLLGTPIGPAAGVLSVAGVFTNPQFQVVLRALSQKKGIDLVSAPKVTTQSGKKATIEIVREFIYPSEFAPPELPPTNGSQYTPVVPNSPSGWETKNTGITLEVEPTVGSDSYTIELYLAPRVIEFDGFINYGNPINVALQASSLLPSKTIEATSNTINQPVFSTREVTTQVSVYDGQTVVMGGLMREDVQKVQDKVPILGDIPLAGRLFRTNVDQHVKRNLIMFVTASLLDPAGQPIIPADEDDHIVPTSNVSGILDAVIPGDPLSAPLPQ